MLRVLAGVIIGSGFIRPMYVTDCCFYELVMEGFVALTMDGAGLRG